MPGERPGPDQIVSSNGFGMRPCVEAAGARGAPAADRPRHRRQASHRSRSPAADADLIVTLGGASVGDHDLVRATLRKPAGLALDFWRIAMRPGKPLMAAAGCGSVPLVGLPGNPVSTMVCAHLFLRPAGCRMLGLPRDRCPARHCPAWLTRRPERPARALHARRAELRGPPATPGLPSGQDSALLVLLAEPTPCSSARRRAGPRCRDDPVEFIWRFDRYRQAETCRQSLTQNRNVARTLVAKRTGSAKGIAC